MVSTVFWSEKTDDVMRSTWQHTMYIENDL